MCCGWSCVVFISLALLRLDLQYSTNLIVQQYNPSRNRAEQTWMGKSWSKSSAGSSASSSLLWSSQVSRRVRQTCREQRSTVSRLTLDFLLQAIAGYDQSVFETMTSSSNDILVKPHRLRVKQHLRAPSTMLVSSRVGL